MVYYETVSLPCRWPILSPTMFGVGCPRKGENLIVLTDSWNAWNDDGTTCSNPATLHVKDIASQVEYGVYRIFMCSDERVGATYCVSVVAWLTAQLRESVDPRSKWNSDEPEITALGETTWSWNGRVWDPDFKETLKGKQEVEFRTNTGMDLDILSTTWKHTMAPPKSDPKVKLSECWVVWGFKFWGSGV